MGRHPGPAAPTAAPGRGIPVQAPAAAHRPGRRWTRVAVAVVCATLLLAGISAYVRVTGKGTDYNVFYLAGRTMVERPGELYHVQAPRGPSYTYIYPPAFAVFMGPLAALPLGASAIAWFLLNAVFFLHGAVILSRTLAPAGHRRELRAWILLLGLPFAVENIFLGQVHGLIAYLMVRSFALLRRRRSVGAGAWMAAAAAIKLMPAVFAVYFLARRDAKGLASFALAGALFTAAPPVVALGPGPAFELLGEFSRMLVLPHLTLGASPHAIYERTAARKTVHDQDLGVLLGRLLGARQGPVPWAGRAVAVLGLVLLAVSTVVAWQRGRDAGAEGATTALAGSIFTVLSLLLSPRNRLAYWTVLVIPWGVLLAWQLRTGPAAHPLVLGTLVASVSLLVLVAVPAPALQAATPGAWGLLVLWGGLIVLAGRPQLPGLLAAEPVP